MQCHPAVITGTHATSWLRKRKLETATPKTPSKPWNWTENLIHQSTRFFPVSHHCSAHIYIIMKVCWNLKMGTEMYYKSRKISKQLHKMLTCKRHIDGLWFGSARNLKKEKRKQLDFVTPTKSQASRYHKYQKNSSFIYCIVFWFSKHEGWEEEKVSLKV